MWGTGPWPISAQHWRLTWKQCEWITERDINKLGKREEETSKKCDGELRNYDWWANEVFNENLRMRYEIGVKCNSEKNIIFIMTCRLKEIKVWDIHNWFSTVKNKYFSPQNV